MLHRNFIRRDRRGRKMPQLYALAFPEPWQFAVLLLPFVSLQLRTGGMAYIDDEFVDFSKIDS